MRPTGLEFEWDPAKARYNLREHGVPFAEAATVFADPLSLTIEDPIHSHDEQRFVDIGRSKRQRLIVVCYTQRGKLIRIISAREPTYGEQKQYEEGA